jgi:hypothetical protein
LALLDAPVRAVVIDTDGTVTAWANALGWGMANRRT